MCSIIGGFESEKVKELIELNQFRGNFSYSYTEFNEELGLVFQAKGFDEFPLGIISKDYYKICHVQAPTGGLLKDHKRIHPVMNKNDMLWHNGLLTPKGTSFLQQKLNTTEEFDTKLLFDALQKYSFDILNDIEGLFSCLYIKDNRMYLFRTKHGKIYIDDNMNISSERFENSKCINADTIYEVDLKNKNLIEIDRFKTKRFNFVIKGEI